MLGTEAASDREAAFLMASAATGSLRVAVAEKEKKRLDSDTSPFSPHRTRPDKGRRKPATSSPASILTGRSGLPMS
ncbi:hypothetical protein [Methylohalobius crimeensis]|uniref:hypothetical protein n=1 Tax=Methylohalobius crimeensis TaxID=244365 RepID=UPI000421A534|nr:hypothetical protein [Methylohalobius crimeensis]